MEWKKRSMEERTGREGIEERRCAVGIVSSGLISQ